MVRLTSFVLCLSIPGTSTPTLRIPQAQLCLSLEPLNSLQCQNPYLRQGLKPIRWGLSSIGRKGIKSISGIPTFYNRQGPSSVRTLLCMWKRFLESYSWGGIRGNEG